MPIPHKNNIQNAEQAEYAEKCNTFAYFAHFAVLSPFYFGDVFESSAFCAFLSGAAAVGREFGRTPVIWKGLLFSISQANPGSIIGRGEME